MATIDENASLRPFHQASWNEPLILELSSPGERGVIPPPVESGIAEAVGDGVSAIPAALRRSTPPGAARAVASPRCCATSCGSRRRRSANDVDIHLGARHLHDEVQPEGERGADPLATRSRDLHPSQDDDTVAGDPRGDLHRFEQILCEISGMDRSPFQPGGGSQAVYANARMIAAYHAARGEARARRDHHDGLLAPVRRRRPGDGRLQGRHALPRRATGYPDLDALKAALSERTAGPDDHEPRGHGHLQPAYRRVRRARPRGRRHLPLRPGERQRHPRHHARARRRASTSASSTCTRRSRRRTARWGCPSAPAGSRLSSRRSCRRPTVEFDGEPLPPRRRPPAVDRQGARVPRRAGDGRPLATRGCWRSAPRACARSPRSPC